MTYLRKNLTPKNQQGKRDEMKTFKKKIEDMMNESRSDYENNRAIWEALEMLADAIDKQIQYS